MDGATNIRIHVDGVNDDNLVLIMIGNVTKSVADILQWLAEIFPPVRRDQKDFPTRSFAAGRKAVAIEPHLRHPLNGIDNGVAGQHNVVFGNAFLEQFTTRAYRRRKMKIGCGPDNAAMHLFRKRMQPVVRAQPGFDMSHSYSTIEGCQRRRSDRCCISLN